MFIQRNVNQNKFRQAIRQSYREDETQLVKKLSESTDFSSEDHDIVAKEATVLIQKARSVKLSYIDDILSKYGLTSQEGIALTCLAEELLRIPDKKTRDLLIQDKLSSTQWYKTLNHDGLFSHASHWSLVMTSQLLTEKDALDRRFSDRLKGLFAKTSMPMIRKIVHQMVKRICERFVMAENIEDAMSSAKPNFIYSYDMLGEAARTFEDADRYYESYLHAVDQLDNPNESAMDGPGISVKLSALYPRFEHSKYQDVVEAVTPKLLALALKAKEKNVNLTVDAEESERLECSLDIIEAVISDSKLNHWNGFGVAVQAYQKRALPLIYWLEHLAKTHQQKIAVRLVKGAYWDYEIKRSQMLGLEGYAVFTRKVSTDISFIACARALLARTTYLYPQFASHNAYTIATLNHLTKNTTDFEYQYLYGMGEEIYRIVHQQQDRPIKCRVYAPVGNYHDLLPYLLRRLLENGANTSFIHQLANKDIQESSITRNPIEHLNSLSQVPHPSIPLPSKIYNCNRKNSLGIDLTDDDVLVRISKEIKRFKQKKWQVKPIISGKKRSAKSTRTVLAPRDNRSVIGQVHDTSSLDIELALQAADSAFSNWSNHPIDHRAVLLEKVADGIEADMNRYIYLLIEEAGKTVNDAIAETREAIDYCRFYANTARTALASKDLQGYTGELNQFSYMGRGTIVCISPWNFPMAIFLGQVVAALVAGNCVVAKPARQTGLVASELIQLCHRIGIPKNVLHFLPGKGSEIGVQLIRDARIKGVLFTGAFETAKNINLELAHRDGPIIPFVAETGGINAMMVDSTALKEQVIDDVLISAFGGAGQRCSALRVLYIQDECYDDFVQGIVGAMQALEVGDPRWLKTDLGPVIDEYARKELIAYRDEISQIGHILYEGTLPESELSGHYFPPLLVALKSGSQLKKEIFGPILHVVKYDRKAIDSVIAEINGMGYGLTFGLQSRMQRRAKQLYQDIRVGNYYVNRSMIGAVVGLQPFGGEGMSGTGPKAGGENYLKRLCVERTLTINTAAIGGNASLLTLDDSI